MARIWFVLATVAALLLAAPAALADARNTTRGAKATASNSPYPPSQCSSVSVDRTVAAPGDPIVVTGTGFRPGQTVDLRLDPSGANTDLGRAVADKNGSFTKTIRFPAVTPGPHFIVAKGAFRLECGADPQARVLGVAAASGQRPTTPAAAGVPGTGGAGVTGGGGLLSFTGFDVALIVIIGLALVGAGVLLLGGDRAGRRRRLRVQLR